MKIQKNQEVYYFRKGSTSSSIVMQKDYMQTVDRFISTSYKRSTGVDKSGYKLPFLMPFFFSHSAHLKTLHFLF